MKNIFYKLISPRYKNENCILCAQSIILKLWCFFGLTSFNFKCNHKNGTYKMETSKFLIGVSTFITISLTTSIFYDIYIEYVDKHNGLLYEAILLKFNGLIVLAFGIFKRNERCRMYNRLLKTLNNLNEFGITVLLPKESVEKLYKIGILIVIYLISTSVLYTILLLVYNEFYRYSRNISFGLCTFLDLAIIFVYGTEITIFNILFKQCHKHVKELLNNYLLSSRNSLLQYRLQSLQFLHICLMQSFSLLVKHCHVWIVFWFGLILSVMIVNIFIVVWAIIYKQVVDMGSKYLFLQLKILVSIVLHTCCIKVIDNLQHVVSRILEY